jgi:adenine-specific DNA-methyltransferase
VSERLSPKDAGAYYTPDVVVSSLLNWAIRDDSDRLLDPSCGDGRFIAGHRNSVGIEQDLDTITTAIERAPWALIHEGDFFAWAAETAERFECAAGNPPFIRYQSFKGIIRGRALDLCARHGADFTGLASSWAPFLVATAGLLKPGGRMAFVVPAEIGHAPYAAPLLEYLVERFATVQIIAVRAKLFPDLSEDCWLLFADGYGGHTNEIRFSVLNRFAPSARPPRRYLRVSVTEWRDAWKRRLRPFLITEDARNLYRLVAQQADTRRFGDLASIGIGYVSGANDFFHLRPSEADRWRIPSRFLHPSVRNGRVLPASRLTDKTVEAWKRADEPILLLRLPKIKKLPAAISQYLDTEAGKEAREAYKCRVRDPWYSVPDVQVPDFFLSYMSGRQPSFVRNDAKCTCTNSVHSVRIKPDATVKSNLASWGSSFVQLSCEIEGHPLGGGMLKLEPREATEIILPSFAAHKQIEVDLIEGAIETMRRWRHYASVV